MRRRSSCCGGTSSCSSDSTPTTSAAEAVSPELRRNRILDCIHGAAAATTCDTDINTKNDSADTNPNDAAQVSPEVLRHRILHLIHGHSSSVGPISDGEDDATVRTTNLTTAPSTTAATVSPELTRYRIMCRIRSRPQSPTKKDDDSSDSDSADGDDDGENVVSQRASDRDTPSSCWDSPAPYCCSAATTAGTHLFLPPCPSRRRRASAAVYPPHPLWRPRIRGRRTTSHTTTRWTRAAIPTPTCPPSSQNCWSGPTGCPDKRAALYSGR